MINNNYLDDACQIFWVCSFVVKHNLSAKISSYQPNFFCYIHIYKLTYKCEKCELFECFANAISLCLNKILFASFKNFIILLVASHILCVNQEDKLTISIKTCVKTPQKRNKSLHIFRLSACGTNV